MALIVKTNIATDLKQEIQKAIAEKKIDTWLIDDDGDFTHSPEQWFCKAWMRLVDIDEEKILKFGIIGNKQVRMTKSLYAIYHGRFAEMLLSHFDEEIDSIEITSNKTEFDYF